MAITLFFFLFFFLQGHVLCYIQDAYSRVMFMSNFRSNVLETVQVAGDVWLSIFCDFCKSIIIHSLCVVSPCSSPDSGSSMAFRISQMLRISSLRILSHSVASDAPQGPRFRCS